MARVLASGKLATKMVFFEKRFDVPDYDNPKEASRSRWRLIHTPWFGVYLHKWYKPDPRPTMHNHPWAFFSIILKGSYTEKRPRSWDKNLWTMRLISWFNLVRRKDFHTVSRVDPGTLSLMFVGRTHQDWGYMTPDGYVNFDKHPHSREFAAAMKARRDNGHV